jgi:hypothetical protein
LSQGQPTPPTPKGTRSQGSRASRGAHQKRRNPALILIPLALVAGAVVLFFVLSGGGDGGGGGIFGGGDDPQTPPFDFTVGKTVAVPTGEKTKPEDLAPAAQEASAAVVPVMDQLYTEAFLDPDNWQNGEYDEVWEVFESGALPTAQQSVETLTLGTTAGDTYETVEPTSGKVRFKVLFDADGNPVSVVAIVEFEALGARKDGTYTSVISQGQYFLRDTGDGWKVYSFSVKRADTEAAPPTPAPSGTASTTTSPGA